MEYPKRNITNRFQVFTIVLFCLVICLPMIDQTLGIVPRNASTEKRLFTEAPRLGFENLKKFPSLYETYYNDSFGFRNILIKSNFLLRVKLLNVSSPIPKVIIGSEGWLYYNSDTVPKDGVTFKDFRGLAPFSGAQLERILKNTEAYRRTVMAINPNAAFVLVVPPNKNTIYPEHLPSRITRVYPKTRLDQIIEYFSGRSSVEIVDIREILVRAKSNYPTYFKTDTHWNEYGAYLGYYEVMKRLERTKPGLHPTPLSTFTIRYLPGSRLDSDDFGDIAAMLVMQDYYTDDVVRLVPKNPRRSLEDTVEYKSPNPVYTHTARRMPVATLPRMVMFRDSFGAWLIPYFSEHFSRSLYLWTHDVEGSTGILRRENPDVVIFEMGERILERLAEDRS